MAIMIQGKSKQRHINAAQEIAQLRAEAAQRAEALAQLEQRGARLEAEAHALAEAAKLARGTRDIPTIAELPIQAAEAKSELYMATRTALIDKPRTFRDLCDELGIEKKHENSLKSVLMRLQRDGEPMVNLGNGSRAIWWIDAHGRIAELVENPILSSKK